MELQPVKNINIQNNISSVKRDQSQNSSIIEKNEEKSNFKLPEDEVEISEEGKKAYEDLSNSEKKDVDKLKQSDQEVKTHEQAHLSAAGGIAVSGANFSYKTGPDGKKYAVGGEVNIDTSKEKDPEDTIKKASQIKRAAMAPASPSSTDLKVAAQADRMMAQAKLELSKEENAYTKTEENYKNPEKNSIDIMA